MTQQQLDVIMEAIAATQNKVEALKALMETTQPLLSITQAAAILGVDRPPLANMWPQAGSKPPAKVGWYESVNQNF